MFISHLIVAALTAVTAAAPPPSRFVCLSKSTPEFLAASQEMASQETLKQSNARASSLAIDLYFHVVAGGTSVGDGNVPNSQLLNQINVMNQAYAPHNIQFILRGVERVLNPSWSDNGDDYGMKKALRKGNYKALNIYFLRNMGGVFGYCNSPTTAPVNSTAFITDGCSVLSSTVPGGSAAPFNLGGTVVHEVGHWFGLAHTFEGNSCSGAGDGVSDTPQQDGPTWGCPTQRDSCPDSPGLDPIHNYMDYSDDSCYNQFTPGQKVRMYDMFSKFRS